MRDRHAWRRSRAGPRCTRSSRASIRRRPRGSSPTTRSASSARWRSTTSPTSRCRSCCKSRNTCTFPYTPLKIALVPGDRARAARAHRRALRRDARAGPDRGAARAARGLRARAATCRRCAASVTARPGNTSTANRPATLREHGIAATRQLAKRQLTWLRAMEDDDRIRLPAPGLERPGAGAFAPGTC